LTLWGFVQQVLLGIPWGNNPAPDALLILFTVLPFAMLWLLGTMYLKTEITNEEIRIQFFPSSVKLSSGKMLKKLISDNTSPLQNTVAGVSVPAIKELLITYQAIWAYSWF
jgi:hypothetical protein